MVIDAKSRITVDHKPTTVAKVLDTSWPQDDFLTLCHQLASYGLPALEGIDPNPMNCVCAAILHGDTQIGVLLRLEPSVEMQVCVLRTLIFYVLMYSTEVPPDCSLS